MIQPKPISFIDCNSLNIALTELFSQPTKDTGVNPAERARFFDGDMNLNAKTRILEQYTDKTIKIQVVLKPKQ